MDILNQRVRELGASQDADGQLSVNITVTNASTLYDILNGAAAHLPLFALYAEADGGADAVWLPGRVLADLARIKMGLRAGALAACPTAGCSGFRFQLGSPACLRARLQETIVRQPIGKPLRPVLD